MEQMGEMRSRLATMTNEKVMTKEGIMPLRGSTPSRCASGARKVRIFSTASAWSRRHAENCAEEKQGNTEKVPYSGAALDRCSVQAIVRNKGPTSKGARRRPH